MYSYSPCFWFLVFFRLAPSVVAQSSSLNSSWAALIPSCPFECLNNTLTAQTAYNCSLADTQCICTAQPLESDFASCSVNCSINDLNLLSDAYSSVCNHSLYGSRGQELNTANILLASLALPAIGLRCYSRYLIAGALWWDDWTIVIAGTGFAGMISTNFLDTHYGMGQHIWDIPNDYVTTQLQIYLVAEVLYIISLVAIKVSVLLFYHRVFQRPFFHKIVSWNVGFVLVAGISFLFVIIFQCTPINGFWDKTVNPRCINLRAVAYSISGIGIAQDLLVILLPVPELASLQMSSKKKWSVMVMFSIGGLACITSIIRLKYLVTFSSMKDPSWDNLIPSLWSSVELAVGIICACLPAIRALANHYLPSLFGLGYGPNSRRASRSIDKGTPSDRYSRSVSGGVNYTHDERWPRVEDTHNDDVSDFRLAEDEELEAKTGKIYVNTTIKIKVSDAPALESPAPAYSRAPSEYSLDFHRPGVHGRISNDPLPYSSNSIPLRQVR